jgi:hypothetical protein
MWQIVHHHQLHLQCIRYCNPFVMPPRHFARNSVLPAKLQFLPISHNICENQADFRKICAKAQFAFRIFDFAFDFFFVLLNNVIQINCSMYATYAVPSSVFSPKLTWLICSSSDLNKPVSCQIFSLILMAEVSCIRINSVFESPIRTSVMATFETDESIAGQCMPSLQSTVYSPCTSG